MQVEKLPSTSSSIVSLLEEYLHTTRNEDSAEDKHEKGKGRNKDENEMFWFYVSMTLGFIMGLWGVLGSLTMKRTWRVAYFKYLDELKDRVFVVIAVKITKRRKLELPITNVYVSLLHVSSLLFVLELTEKVALCSLEFYSLYSLPLSNLPYRLFFAILEDLASFHHTLQANHLHYYDPKDPIYTLHPNI